MNHDMGSLGDFQSAILPRVPSFYIFLIRVALYRNPPTNDLNHFFRKEEMLGFFNEKDNGKRNSPESGSDSNSISDIIESAGRSGGKRFGKILEKVFHAYLQNKNP